MKKIVFAAMLGLSLFIQAQEIEFNKKTNIVSVDGVDAFIIEDASYGTESIVKDLAGNKLAIFTADSYSDQSKVTSGNPKGTVTYMKVVFLTESVDKCEISSAGVGLRKNLAKHLIENELIKDGQLNLTAVKQYVAIHGLEYSERRKETKGNVIIINNR